VCSCVGDRRLGWVGDWVHSDDRPDFGVTSPSDCDGVSGCRMSYMGYCESVWHHRHLVHPYCMALM